MNDDNGRNATLKWVIGILVSVLLIGLNILNGLALFELADIRTAQQKTRMDVRQLTERLHEMRVSMAELQTSFAEYRRYHNGAQVD